MALPSAARQELGDDDKQRLFDALGQSTELPEVPTGSDDHLGFEQSLRVLEAYVVASYPGLDEDREAALELARELARRSQAFGRKPREGEWLVLKQAELLQGLGRGKAALELLGHSPSDPESRFEFALLAAQLEESTARREERLLSAEAALASIEKASARDELESMWCSTAANRALDLGLPERAAEPLARGFASARRFLTQSGDRRRLDDALLTKIAMHHALIEHERVLELLQRSNADLPPEDSLAARRLDVREGISRAILETLGRPPADRATRAPDALLERTLTDARLSVEDRWLALAALVQLWLDRGDTARAAEALARMRDLALSARRVDDRVSFSCEIAVRRGERAEFTRLRDAARAEWRAHLARHKDLAARDPELGLLHFDEVARLFRALARLDLELEGPERGAETALRELVDGQAIGSMAQALGAKAPTLAEVRAQIVEGELALLHVLVREQGLLFALTREKVELVPLARLPDFVAARREFSLALDRALAGEDGASWDEVDRLSAELGRLALPGELQARVARARRLSIVAPENLGYVPFELLPGPDGAPLGLTLEVRYWPSLPVGTELAERRRTRPAPAVSTKDIALLCAARPAPLGERAFEPLPAGEPEIASLLAPFDAARRAVRAGDGASRAGLDELLTTHAPVLELLCHGYSDRRLVRPARLALEHEPLDAETVEGLSFPPLVLLVACGTWEGPRRRGDDGRAHLPSAFLLGGADTVIAAQRPLLFRPALEFFSTVHRELRVGATPSGALRAARAHVAKSSTSRRERALACLIHAVGLADVALYR